VGEAVKRVWLVFGRHRRNPGTSDLQSVHATEDGALTEEARLRKLHGENWLYWTTSDKVNP